MFDPDAAARPDSGIFGLDCSEVVAGVVLVPVPFDATTSYGTGTAEGPAAILAASRQVDLYDVQTGRPYERGIFLRAADPEIVAAAGRARALAQPILARGSAATADAGAVAEVDRLCRAVHDDVCSQVEAILAAGKIPGVVGGDHSVALGGIKAVAAAFPGVGVLQIDAHADLRPAYEGFRYSHASIMENVLREVAEVSRIVQIGIRDVCEAEIRLAAEDPRVVLHHDLLWRGRMAHGEVFADLCAESVAALPAEVHVSFDIDGLDPSLCPHTGTPVPGGLSFAEACVLLQTVVESGRRIVGFDLSEVAPGPDGDEWDGNVGARILYKLCGFSLLGEHSRSS